MGTVTTDENGEAFLSDLPLGSYQVKEVKAPEGFVLNEEVQTVTFTYKDQDTPVIEQEAIFQNDRQKVEVLLHSDDLNTLYSMFNDDPPADFKAHSISAFAESMA